MVLSVLFSTDILYGQSNQLTTLLPVPKHMTFEDGKFVVGSEFSISVKADKTDSTLYSAVNRALQTLNRRTNLYFGQQRITSKDTSNTNSFIITVKQKLAQQIGQDESYQLHVTANQIQLNAASTTGALHGLETFLQLVQHTGPEFYLPLVTINDAPRFIWRGLMIDVARHFIPLDVIKRNMDAMAAVKMNVLHLHLSDDEGFRVESKFFPELQKKGSYGEYYTQAQLRELLAYAKERGIVVVPEFDMPGHTTSFLAAYPYLASAPGPYQPGLRFQTAGKQLGLADIMSMINTSPTPAFDPSSESTYTFLDKFLGEMAVLFPSPYLHIGADENNGVSWKNNPAIVAFMQRNKLADTHALQAYFVKRVQKILTKYHKRTVGWEELVSADLPKDVIVQVWQNPTYISRATKQGNAVIISKGYYLDLFMPAYVHYTNELMPASIPDSLQSKIIGGEAALWTEAADKNNIETRIWPRTTAIAERLWSPGAVNDIDDFYRRSFIISKQLDELGLQHISNYEKGLRRLTGGRAIEKLKTLTDVLTPVKGYKKLFVKMTSLPSHLYQTAPVNAISDLVFVDSEVKRNFRKVVNNYLKNKDEESRKNINNHLINWQENSLSLGSLVSEYPLNSEVKEHAKNLNTAASIGLEALTKLAANEKPSPEWIKQKMDELLVAKKVCGEAELAIIPEIEALVNQQMKPEPATYSVF
ncbi:hypothetical protein GCM10028808_32200 [Spirosoma migulaei]